MPWRVEKRESEFCVIKEANNSIEGCHATRKDANAQLAALNIAEGKEIAEVNMEDSENKDMVTVADVVGPGVPFGVSSFAELETSKESQAKSQRLDMLSRQFQSITENIMHNPDTAPGEKVSAVNALAVEFGTLVNDALEEKERWQPLTNAVKAVVEKVKEKVAGDPEPEPENEFASFELWKEDDGVMRWMSFFSNNYRDDDVPAEILSADAHRDFVKAVDDGEWPLPELRFWHVPGSKFGEADFVAFDENTSMVLACGTIDKGRERIAEHCQANGYRTSHGMPSTEIERDADDPTIITRYRTKEITWLPPEVAANKHTSNFVVQKEQDYMNIPEKKLEEMKAAGFDTEALTAQAEAQKNTAEEEGRESKELETVEKDEVVQVEALPPVETAPVLDATSIASAVSTAMERALTPIVDRLAVLEESAKEKSEPKTEPEPETKEWNLSDAILSHYGKSAVIGREEAQVDGRKARHEGPKETKAVTEVTRIPFLDNMLSGGDWRDGVKN